LWVDRLAGCRLTVTRSSWWCSVHRTNTEKEIGVHSRKLQSTKQVDSSFSSSFHQTNIVMRRYERISNHSLFSAYFLLDSFLSFLTLCFLSYETFTYCSFECFEVFIFVIDEEVRFRFLQFCWQISFTFSPKKIRLRILSKFILKQKWLSKYSVEKETWDHFKLAIKRPF
jgi:hypothetical protein